MVREDLRDEHVSLGERVRLRRGDDEQPVVADRMEHDALGGRLLVETIVRRQVADGERLVAAVRVPREGRARPGRGVPIVGGLFVEERRHRLGERGGFERIARLVHQVDPAQPRTDDFVRGVDGQLRRLRDCSRVIEVPRPLAEPRQLLLALLPLGDVACVDHESADSVVVEAVTPDRLHPQVPSVRIREPVFHRRVRLVARDRLREHLDDSLAVFRVDVLEGVLTDQVRRVVAEDPLHRGARVLERPVRVERGDDVAGALDERAVSLAFCHVPDDADEPSLAVLLELPERYRQGDLTAVPVLPGKFGRRPVYRALLGRAVPLDSLTVRLALPLRHQRCQRLAFDLRGRVAEQPLDGRVREPNSAVAVDGEDGVHRVIGDRPQVGLCPVGLALDPALLGCVDDAVRQNLVLLGSAALLEVVRHARGDGLAGDRLRPLPGVEDEGEIRVALPDRLQELDPVRSRHVVVGDDTVDIGVEVEIVEAFEPFGGV